MKTGGYNANNVLYGVNVRCLSIKAYSTASHEEKKCITSTYEDFYCGEPVRKRKNLTQDELPILIDGIMYFASRDEANEFLKSQIGL